MPEPLHRRAPKGKLTKQKFSAPGGMPVIKDPSGGYVYQQSHEPRSRISPRKERRRAERLKRKIAKARARASINVIEVDDDE